jgi:SAM-dependent methyltransferase
MEPSGTADDPRARASASEPVGGDRRVRASASEPVGGDRQEKALSFGVAAVDYDRYRPSYPPDALRWALGSDPLHVVDLGAGTGLLTRVLTGLGHQVIPVEPDAAMRAQLSASGDLAEPRVGSAEAIPLRDGSVDAVVAGQAYHWFDRERAHPEIARVLGPSGVFAPVWNIRDDAVPWVAALTRIVNAVGGGDAQHEGWIDNPDFGPLFDQPEREIFRHVVPMTADSLVAMMRTRSYFLTAPPKLQAEVEAALRGLTADLPDTFDLPYRTIVYRARRGQRA